MTYHLASTKKRRWLLISPLQSKFACTVRKVKCFAHATYPPENNSGNWSGEISRYQHEKPTTKKPAQLSIHYCSRIPVHYTSPGSIVEL